MEWRVFPRNLGAPSLEPPSVQPWVNESCHLWGMNPIPRLLSLPCEVSNAEQCPHLWMRKWGTTELTQPLTQPSQNGRAVSLGILGQGPSELSVPGRGGPGLWGCPVSAVPHLLTAPAL